MRNLVPFHDQPLAICVLFYFSRQIFLFSLSGPKPALQEAMQKTDKSLRKPNFRTITDFCCYFALGLEWC